jgi:DMSO/TMAO reductase YedYZ molybdopterin-dependent catalytic subunit
MRPLHRDKRPWTVENRYPAAADVADHPACLRRGLEPDRQMERLPAANLSPRINVPTALHPQTIMAFTFADQVLPRRFGYPMKIRIPAKLGFKNPKIRPSAVGHE